MTRDEYGAAYQKNHPLTLRLLVSHGVAYEVTYEVTQAAWAKGWERLGQLRNPNMVLVWVNSIALNVYRSYLRREPITFSLDEARLVSSSVEHCAINRVDTEKILRYCIAGDESVLIDEYLEGKTIREIAMERGWTELATRGKSLRVRRVIKRRLANKGIKPPYPDLDTMLHELFADRPIDEIDKATVRKIQEHFPATTPGGIRKRLAKLFPESRPPDSEEQK